MSIILMVVTPERCIGVVQPTYRMNYPQTYRTPIHVTKFEKNLTDAQLTYEFVDAFPLNVISMPVSYFKVTL